MRVEIRLGACDEERPSQMQPVQPREIDVAPIHDIDSTRLRDQQVEDASVVHLAIGAVDEAGNAAAQIQQRMHLHRCLGRSEMRPWKYRQAQIDGGRIQCVHRVGQIQAQVFAGVKRSGLGNQTVSEFGVDAPVAQFVGIGQCRTGYRASDAHVVELGSLCRETGFDVA